MVLCFHFFKARDKLSLEYNRHYSLGLCYIFQLIQSSTASYWTFEASEEEMEIGKVNASSFLSALQQGKSEHMQRRLSVAIALVFLVLSAWLAGKMVWLFSDDVQVAPWQPTTSSNTGSSGPALTDIAELQRSFLFGEYTNKPEPVAAPVVTDAPKTRLNLILVGAVANSNPERGLAVIANRGQQATYGVGEVIDGTRARLKAVLIDRVIIENSGRDETLMLEGIEYKRLEQPSQASTPKQVNSAANTNSDSQLDKIKAEITAEPQKIFQYVRLSQVKRDGDILGYRVSPGRQPELFNSVGLQNGDIAIQLNGQDLTDPEAMSNIFKSIAEVSELNLTVERSGQQHDIYIEF